MQIILSLVMLSLVMLETIPSAVLASESCAMMSGKCRAACGANEKAEAGDFLDCEPKYECCVAQAVMPVQFQCCILSQEAGDFGPANCEEPANGVCPKGSGSLVPCSELNMCATAK